MQNPYRYKPVNGLKGKVCDNRLSIKKHVRNNRDRKSSIDAESRRQTFINSHAWSHILAFPALRTVKQKDYKFKASLRATARP